jgi:hypothetical protein
MNLDIRVPIGILFTIVGLLLAGYGLASDPTIYQRSLGYNVNVDWGIVLLIFGIIMLVFGRRVQIPRSSEIPPEESAPRE